MKLNALHLFLILLGSLLLCSILGNPTVEGMSGKSGRARKVNKKRVDNTEININEYSTTIEPNDNFPKASTIDEDEDEDNYNSSISSNRNDTNYHSSDYNNGNQDEEVTYNTVPASQIPAGSEDLYVLKSEIVPPVCPACPSNSSCPSSEPPPPCPPCARCPEPAFDCKKVPNYRVNDEDSLPRPVLADFSQFGM